MKKILTKDWNVSTETKEKMSRIREKMKAQAQVIKMPITKIGK